MGLLVFLAPVPAFSQADSLQTVALEEIVVSVTRSPQKVFNTGRNVSVINGKEIENSVYSSVAEILSAETGIYVIGTRQNPGMNQSLFLRGAAGNHTTILVDGIRVTDPSTPNTALDLSGLSLLNVERIEIVRGSHGTLYGTSGIGGVINIITKKGQSQGFTGQAALQAGTFARDTYEWKENVSGSYSFKNGWYVNLAAQNRHTNGMNASIDTIRTEGVYKTADKDGFDKFDAVAKAGFQNKRWDLFASYKYISQQAEIDDGAFNDDDNYALDFRRDLVNYGGSHALSERWKLTFNGGWSSLGRLSENDSSVVDEAGTYDHAYFESDYNGTTWTNEIQATYSATAFNLLAGIGHYDEQADFYTFAYSSGPFAYSSRVDYDSIDLVTSTRYLFLQADLGGRLASEKLQALHLVLGGRYSGHNRFGQNFDFEINPRYRIGKNTLVYASYSTGFNAPSLVQLFDPSQAAGNYTSLGNPDLEPEASATVEVGLKQNISNRISFTLAGFHTKVDNAIEYVYLWNKNTSLSDLTFNDYLGDTYINIATQKNYGVELDLEAIISKSLSVRGGFSLVKGRYRYSPSAIDREYTGGNHVQLFSNGAFVDESIENEGLVRRPVTMLDLRADFRPVENLIFSGRVHYAGEREDSFYDPSLGPFGALSTTPVKGYALVDFSARYRLNRHVSLALKIENLLNKDYLEINGYSTRGRGVHIKIGASL